MSTWTTKIDALPSGSEQSIAAEEHVIGEHVTNHVLLDQLPLSEDPSTVYVEIDGSPATEVFTAPSAGQYRVKYTGIRAGMIEHHSSDNGKDVEVSYMGRGSVLFGFHINDLQTLKADLTGAAFSGAVSATSFSGPLTGNVTGNVSGSSGSCTGNAATASVAPAGTLTGTTLAANVVTSSLTSVGTLTSLTVSGTSAFGGDITLNRANANGYVTVNQSGTESEVGFRLTRSGGTAADWFMYAAPGSSSLTFYSGGAKAVLTTAGALSLAAGISATTGQYATTIGVGAATPAASGAGVTFPATQSASSDANTLDDYEEGTSNPTMSADGGGTVTIDASWNTLQYTKIGRQVHVHGELRVGSVSSPSGFLGIALPFTAAAGSEGSGATAATLLVNGATGVPAGTAANGLVQPGTNTLRVYGISQGNVGGGFADYVTAGTAIFISVTYDV